MIIQTKLASILPNSEVIEVFRHGLCAIVGKHAMRACDVLVIC